MQISQAKRVSLCSAQSEAQSQQMPETRIEKSAAAARTKKSVFSGLSFGQLMVIGLLAVANFCATVTFSSIVPFFPTEAIHRKGLTTAQVGLIIGGFQLVVFLMSPLIGKNMNLLGQYRAFSGGILLSGLATIAFGIASLLPSGTPFFVGMLLIRTFQAVGSSAFSTGSWAIVGRLFPDRINMITAINEISYGLGFTLGPPMGSALYEMGGYALPLYVVGVAQLLVVMLSVALYRSSSLMAQVPHLNSERSPAEEGADASTHQEKDRHPTVFRLLFIPDVFMTMVSLFAVCFAWSFYEPDLAQHLSTFPSNWSPPLLVGFNMTLLSCSYMLAAPIWGFLMDRCLAGRTTSVMVFGAILVLIFCLLVGPVPVLGLPKTLFCIGISFVFLGISGAVLYVPVFKWCVDAAKSRGYDEKSPALCGLISGLFQSTVSLGAFLGTFLGGLSAERIGFQWTAAWVAGLQIVQLLLQLLYALAKRLQKGRNSPRIMPTLETTTIYRQKY